MIDHPHEHEWGVWHRVARVPSGYDHFSRQCLAEVGCPATEEARLVPDKPLVGWVWCVPKKRPHEPGHLTEQGSLYGGTAPDMQPCPGPHLLMHEGEPICDAMSGYYSRCIKPEGHEGNHDDDFRRYEERA